MLSALHLPLDLPVCCGNNRNLKLGKQLLPKGREAIASTTEIHVER